MQKGGATRIDRGVGVVVLDRPREAEAVDVPCVEVPAFATLPLEGISADLHEQSVEQLKQQGRSPDPLESLADNQNQTRVREANPQHPDHPLSHECPWASRGSFACSGGA